MQFCLILSLSLLLLHPSKSLYLFLKDFEGANGLKLLIIQLRVKCWELILIGKSVLVEFPLPLTPLLIRDQHQGGTARRWFLVPPHLLSNVRWQSCVRKAIGSFCCCTNNLIPEVFKVKNIIIPPGNDHISHILPNGKFGKQIDSKTADLVGDICWLYREGLNHL